MSVFICSFNANELKEPGAAQVQADGTAFRSTHRSGGPASRASAPYTPNECREARVSAPQAARSHPAEAFGRRQRKSLRGRKLPQEDGKANKHRIE